MHLLALQMESAFYESQYIANATVLLCTKKFKPHMHHYTMLLSVKLSNKRANISLELPVFQ